MNIRVIESILLSTAALIEIYKFVNDHLPLVDASALIEYRVSRKAIDRIKESMRGPDAAASAARS